MKKRLLSMVSVVIVSSFLMSYYPNFYSMDITPNIVYSKEKKKIHFEHSTYTINQGEQVALKLKNTKKKPVFSVQDQKVAIIDKKTGVLTGKNLGSTTVIAKISEKEKYQCKVNVVFAKGKVATQYSKQEDGKVLELPHKIKIILPENWDYEIHKEDKNYIQYTCLNLPDNEYKGCIYVKEESSVKKNTSISSYTKQALKQSIGELYASGTVSKGSFSMKKFQKEWIGVASFEVAKSTGVEYRTIFVQKRDNCFIQYESVATNLDENNNFIAACFHMMQSLQTNEGADE